MIKNTVEARNLKKYFPLKLGFRSLSARKALSVRAVDDVSFEIKEREIYGLIGESGCGKTTTGRCLLRLIEPTEGKILFKGKDITELHLHSDMRKLRRQMQIIFQDPYESLNPRMTVYDIIAEPLRIQHVADSLEETLMRVSASLEDMGMVPPEEFLYRFPHELSGGQRQRVAIARAFVLDPEFIVADEPFSMLDASIRSEVLKLVLHLTRKTKCSFLYITHDVALARYLCDKIAVMYLGKIVEEGPVEAVIKQPYHPYTQALLAAVPVPDPTARRTEVVIKGEVPNPWAPPPGCRFHPRCPHAQEKCRKNEPLRTQLKKDRFACCHYPLS